MVSPVHVLMLSIQAVRGLPRLRAPGIVPYIISFSVQQAGIMGFALIIVPGHRGRRSDGVKLSVAGPDQRCQNDGVRDGLFHSLLDADVHGPTCQKTAGIVIVTLRYMVANNYLLLPCLVIPPPALPKYPQTPLILILLGLIQQEEFEKCWAHSPLRPAARRLF